MTIEHVETRRFIFEPNVSLEDESPEPVFRFVCERGGRVESAADFRSVDSKQADAANVGKKNRVAVDDRAYEQGLGSFWRLEGLRKGNGGEEYIRRICMRDVSCNGLRGPRRAAARPAPSWCQARAWHVPGTKRDTAD